MATYGSQVIGAIIILIFGRIAAGIGGWFKDEFASFKSRYYIGPQLGHRHLTGPKHFLTGEVDLYYVTEHYIDDTDTILSVTLVANS